MIGRTVSHYRIVGKLGEEKHFVFEGGHVPTQLTAVIREILDWLDRYLGPVGARG